MLECLNFNSEFFMVLNIFLNGKILSTNSVKDLHILFFRNWLSSQIKIQIINLSLLINQDSSEFSHSSLTMMNNLFSFNVIFNRNLLSHKLLSKHSSHTLLIFHHFFDKLINLQTLVLFPLSLKSSHLYFQRLQWFKKHSLQVVVVCS